MCTLNDKLYQKNFTGWKVVVEHNKKYYSPATGILYQENKPIPIPKKFKPLSNYFVNMIYKHSLSYRPSMIGMTAIFRNRNDALYFKKLLQKTSRIDCGKLKVVKATVSEDLREGVYYIQYLEAHVVAGKKISFFRKDKNLIPT